MLSFSLDTADPARGALHPEGAASSAPAIETQLLFFDLEWNQVPDERADELLAAPELALRRPPPAQRCAATARTSSRSPRSACSRRPTSPAARPSSGSSPSRPPLSRCRCPTATSRPRSRRACRGSRTPTASGAREAAAAVTESLRPGLRHARLRLQHAAPGQGDQGPAARLPALARVAQPRERGERRVGRGADRGRAGPLRPGAALVLAEGAAAGPRQARLLRPHGPGVRQRRPHPLRRGRGDRARLLPHLLAGARRDGRRSSSPAATSTARRALASAAARSARTRCPRRTRT